MGFGPNLLAQTDENLTSTYIGAYGDFSMPIEPDAAGFLGPTVYRGPEVASYPSNTNLMAQPFPANFPAINPLPNTDTSDQSANLSHKDSSIDREILLLAQLVPPVFRSHKRVDKNQSSSKADEQEKQPDTDDSDTDVYDGEKAEDAIARMDELFKKKLVSRLNEAGLDGETFVRETRLEMYGDIEEDIKKDVIVCLNADRASLQKGATNSVLLKVPDGKCWKGYVCSLSLRFAGLLFSFASG